MTSKRNESWNYFSATKPTTNSTYITNNITISITTVTAAPPSTTINYQLLKEMEQMLLDRQVPPQE
jgi:hypothetical protein